MNRQYFWLLMIIATTLIGCADNDKNIEDIRKLPSSTHHDEVLSSGKLSGLYRHAGENSPVILIVPGSGPTDLNGNNSLGVTSNTYKLLSEALASQGISTVRVDKRGMFSSKSAGNPNAVSVDIYANDYRKWVERIRITTNQPCVYMLGHSEGGIMVSAASINNPNVCGLILVSSPGRPFGEILSEQLKANRANKPILKDALKAIETLENGLPVDVSEFHPALKPLFAPSVQTYLMSLMKTDPAQLVKQADKPTLIIQGSNDIQINLKDAERLAEFSDGSLVIIDGMNHILKQAPASRRGNIKTYKNPDLPISTEVIDAISYFIFD